MNVGRSTAGRALVAIAAAIAVVFTVGVPTPSRAADPIVLSWVTWTPPAAYPLSGSSPSSYTYASTALGELQIPGGPLVYVRLTGEVVNPTLGTATTTCAGYCGPSGFTSNDTTRPDYWQKYPLGGGGANGTGPGAGSAFVSANLPAAQLPPNGDHIGLVGGASPTQTLEFFADAARQVPTSVRNIVMLVGSLGSGATPASWDFTQDFDILSDNSSEAVFAGLARTEVDPGGPDQAFRLSGREGSGAIQFVGSFTSISWTVSAPEVWASWNISASSQATSRGAEIELAELGPVTVPPLAGPTLALTCTPDPVAAGATVTCAVEGGDPDIDILWRASVDGAIAGPFAGQGVTLDARGLGSFTFRVPSNADGRSILIELVEWSTTDTVTVSGAAIPNRIPAGDGSSMRSEVLLTGVLALGLTIGLALRSSARPTRRTQRGL